MTPKYSAVETFPPYSPITGVTLIDAKPPNDLLTVFVLGVRLVFKERFLSEWNQSFTNSPIFSSNVSQS